MKLASRVKHLAFFGLLLSLGCASGQKDKDVAVLHLNLGTSLLANGNYRASLKELLLAEKLDSSNPIVQNNLGLNYFMLEQAALAEKHLQKAVDISSEYSDAHNNLARVLIDLARYDEAQAHARKVLSDLTYPQPEKAWINLGLSYFAQRKFQNALAPFQKAVKLDQQNCLANTMLGRTQYELAHFREAARVLDWGAKYCEASRFDEPLYYAGLAYYKAGDRERGIARMETLLKIYPQGKYATQANSMRKIME